mgnify:CR=1 FL=1
MQRHTECALRDIGNTLTPGDTLTLFHEGPAGGPHMLTQREHHPRRPDNTCSQWGVLLPVV